MNVNLGIGIPTLLPQVLPEGVKVNVQAENGLIGAGPYPYEGEEDPDLINAGKVTKYFYQRKPSLFYLEDHTLLPLSLSQS